MQILAWGVVGVISAFAVGAAVKGLSGSPRSDRDDNTEN